MLSELERKIFGSFFILLLLQAKLAAYTKNLAKYLALFVLFETRFSLPNHNFACCTIEVWCNMLCLNQMLIPEKILGFKVLSGQRITALHSILKLTSASDSWVKNCVLYPLLCSVGDFYDKIGSLLFLTTSSDHRHNNIIMVQISTLHINAFLIQKGGRWKNG